jgi:hypothetical protein
MMVESKGQTIEIFLIDGKPDGMLTARVWNREGRVLKTPRAQILDAFKNVGKESGYTGIYLLFGEKGGKPCAYIGEADNVGARVRIHHIKMDDWWDTVVLITAAENTMTKSHARYLESRLIERARDVGKTTLENDKFPPLPGLGGKAAEAGAEAFLVSILMILPAIGIHAFVDNTRPPAPSDAPLFELQRPKHGIQATARLVGGEFVVQAGSFARADWTTKAKQSQAYAGLYAELVRRGLLQKRNEHRVFKTNCAFKSPSAAASVVNGYTSNGNWWKVQGQHMTYYQWEIENLAGDRSGDK